MKNENEIIDIKGRIDTVLSNEKTTSLSEQNLYSLLTDHPYFNNQSKSIRESLKIPSNGYGNSQEAFNWEKANKSNKTNLWRSTEKLIAQFKIKPELITKAHFYARDYILLPNRVRQAHTTAGKLAGARIVKTSENVEVNKYLFLINTDYIEVGSSTTQRDIIKAFSKLNSKRKIDKTNVLKPQILARTIWLLSQKGKSGKEIKARVKELLAHNIAYYDIPIYRLRYERALKKLKNF